MLWKARRRRSGWFQVGRSPAPTMRSGFRSVVLAFRATAGLLEVGSPPTRRGGARWRSGLDRSIVADQSVEQLPQLTVREADLAECGQDGLRGDAVLRRFPPIAHQRVKVRVARRPREADAHQGPDVEPRDGQKGRRPRARDL